MKQRQKWSSVGGEKKERAKTWGGVGRGLERDLWAFFEEPSRCVKILLLLDLGPVRYNPFSRHFDPSVPSTAYGRVWIQRTAFCP
jgi:hypothetical protein